VTGQRPPEPVTVLPPRTVGRTVFTQTWADLTFLHWAVDPAVVAPHLPRGTRPDTLAGSTYVGLVPFVMRRVGIAGSPGLPYLGTFCETNVRLYSVDEQGRRGVVFASLDAARLAPVLVARWGAGLPYLWSRMRCHHHGDEVGYTCRRRWPGPPGTSSRIRVRVGPPIEAGPLEHFLTARWGLHLVDRNPGLPRTRYWPNTHPQWPLQQATLLSMDDGILAAAGFPGLADRSPDSVLHSTGVRVVFGPRLPAGR
jgi:uncharacterized protein